MSYSVEMSPEAQRELRALPGYVKSQALQILSALAQNPRPPQAVELRNKPGIYRIWLAGRWRIVYKIDNDLVLISVIRIRAKDQIDYENI